MILEGYIKIKGELCGVVLLERPVDEDSNNEQVAKVEGYGSQSSLWLGAGTHYVSILSSTW